MDKDNKNRKIIDVLMNDETFIVKKDKEELEEKIRRIAKSTGYPEVVIKKVLDDLSSKGIDQDVVKLFTKQKSKKIIIIDILIILSLISFITSLFYYIFY